MTTNLKNLEESTIAFIGGGNMARSIVMGLLANKHDPHKIWVTNRTNEKRDFFRDTYKVQVTEDNQLAASNADILVLSVKPKQIELLCESLKLQIAAKKPLIISVASGVHLKHLKKWLATEVSIVRAMPNTPAALGVGATGLYAEASVNRECRAIAEQLFRAVGMVDWVVEEAHMDLVAAVSGSGPAYLFLFMEAMQEAAQKLGLSAEVSSRLVKQTMLGAASMAMGANEDVVALRRQVTSPGGSTEQAIAVFEAAAIREVMKKALSAAVNKSQETARELEKNNE